MSEPANLDSLAFPALKAWLRDALHDRVALPREAPDEYPFLAVHRLEMSLERSIRRDIARAVHELALELVRAADAPDLAYVHNLLRLVVLLEINDVARDLAHFAEQPILPDSLRRHVLAAVIDLHVPQPPDYWAHLLERTTDRRLVVTIFSGLLQKANEQAVAHMPRLPDDPELADAIVGAFDALQATMTEPARSTLLQALKSILPRCRPAIHAGLTEWLPSVTSIPATARDYNLLDSALERLLGPFQRLPRHARLAA